MLWELICTVHFTVCSYHVTYAFQGESALYICLNIKELLAQNWHEIWSLSGCNGTQTYNHLVHKQTCIHDMIRLYTQMHHTEKYSQHSSITWPVWLNGWVFVFEISGCGFKSRCSHLNFKFLICFKQGVPWHSGKYSVWIQSETHMWHDKNIHSNALYRNVLTTQLNHLAGLAKWLSGFEFRCSHLTFVKGRVMALSY